MSQPRSLVHFGVASNAEITAITANDRGRGALLVLNTATGYVWRWDASSTASASSTVLVPDDNPAAGRWLALDTIALSSATAASLETRLSTEESTRASVVTSLTTRISTEESTRASLTTSLTTRVSSSVASIDLRLSTLYSYASL